MGNMSLHNHALYQVATKALLYKGGKILVLYTPDGYIDFPGGRVDESERDLSWHEALQREIAEEIGELINISVGKTLFVAKRQYHSGGKTHHIAAIYFECQYLDGEINLSDEHGNHEWLTPEELLSSTKKYMSEDEKLQLQTLFA